MLFTLIDGISPLIFANFHDFFKITGISPSIFNFQFQNGLAPIHFR